MEGLNASKGCSFGAGRTVILLVRLLCENCGERIGSIERDGAGELRCRLATRTKMLGRSLHEARRWEYGTSQVGPRDGPPPTGARIFPFRQELVIWDPRRGPMPPNDPTRVHRWDEDEVTGQMIAPEDLAPGEAVYREPVERIGSTCRGCARRFKMVTASELASALTKYDRTGKPATLRLPHPPLPN